MSQPNANLEILLVEDDRAQSRVMQRIMEKHYVPVDEKVFVTTAESLEIAINKIQEKTFDVILLDLNLPDSKGFDTVVKILEQKVTAAVIVLTSHDDRSAALNAVQQGAQDYIVKNTLNPADLVNSIRNAIERNRIKKKLDATLSELEIAKDEALAATKVKSRFLANMSHELRTPLTAILGFSDIACEDELTKEELDGCLESIASNAKHMLELINDILDMSKIEAGQIKIESIEFDLCQIIKDVENVMLPKARLKNIDFAVMTNSALPKKLLSDPLRLKQILLNLVGNAIKFTSEGHVHLVLECSNIAPERLVVQIVDTGIGMTKEQCVSVFLPFQQADGTTTRNFGGTGLGLTISKELVGLLGGEIWVESEPGKGSKFIFSIATGHLKGVPMIEKMPDSWRQILRNH